MSIIIENKDIEIYNFENENIRVVGTPENPFFVVKDICNILELSNVTNTMRNIPDKWKSSEIIKSTSGEQLSITVNESGLYKLIMRSNKPIAQKFQEWVCGEVLPSIRKKGQYKLEEYKQKIEEQNNRIKNYNERLNLLMEKMLFI